MKKSTDDLMKILRSKRSVDEYFDENDSEIFFGTLHELVRFFMARKGLEKAGKSLQGKEAVCPKCGNAVSKCACGKKC